MKTRVIRVSGILLMGTLAGCQTVPMGDPSAGLVSRYPQRNLTVAWSERQYWHLPPDARIAPPPPYIAPAEALPWQAQPESPRLLATPRTACKKRRGC